MVLQRVAVVVPAYNEEALDQFLTEIEASLVPVTSYLEFVVVDDCSPTPLPLDLPVTRLPLGTTVRTFRNARNLGHGPSAVAAYAAGLNLDPEVIIHVDGDGQFLGRDFPTLLAALDGHDGVIGSRTGRREPWFRRMLSLGARTLVGHALRGSDVNSPLRAYRASVVSRLLDHVPSDSVVPHLRFAVLHDALGLDMIETAVTHRPRRGDSEVGTTWQSGTMPALLPSRRLIGLTLRAIRELSRGTAPSIRESLSVATLEDAA